MSMSEEDTDFAPRSSETEKINRKQFAQIFAESPIPQDKIVYSQLSLYLSRQELARMLVLSDIYRTHVLYTTGVLFEFGTCYGRTAALLTNLRGIFEPYNFTRKLAIFDTFSGLLGCSTKDGAHESTHDGAYCAGQSYESHLEAVLRYHECEAPIAHIRKYEIIKGDAVKTLKIYLKNHPETIVALAYFDFDIYEPTKSCLALLRAHLTKNSVLVFDELNCPEYPGETLALSEVFGLNRCNIRRSPLTPWMSYVIGDDLLS